MGIKKLHQILEKYASKCYNTKHLSCYSFKKVAIDISLYLYKYKAIAGERWVESFLSLINCLRKWDIHPIFIYDGVAPIEKLEEQKRRRESRDKQNEKIKELEKQIKDYEQKGIVGNLIEEICKKKVSTLFKRESQTSQSSQTYDINLAKDKLDSMKGMVISITEYDLKLTRDLFDVLCIPYVRAPGEAENFASHLCIYNQVDCVLSEDTDVLAYGTPIFLTKIDTLNDTVVEISYSKILEETGFTKDTFTDLCIMLECDYNNNIYMVGPEKSYTMLKSYNNIENVLDELKKLKNKDSSPKYTDEMFLPLKYKRCRELFTTNKVDFYVPYCGIPDFKIVKEFFYINNLKFNLEKLQKNMKERVPTLIFEDVKENIIESVENVPDSVVESVENVSENDDKENIVENVENVESVENVENVDNVDNVVENDDKENNESVENVVESNVDHTYDKYELELEDEILIEE